jgi:hypothetical protein
LVGDTTLGLGRQGTVRIRLPRDTTELGVPVAPTPELAGTGGFPPELEDEGERRAYDLRS